MSGSVATREGLSRSQSLGFALAYVALALLGRSTVLPGAAVSLVWPAAGLAVLWLLAEHPRRQARVLVTIAAELAVVLALTGAAWPLLVAGAASVVAQTWLVVVLLRRWCPDLLGAGGADSVHSPRTLVVATGIVLVSCALGALLVSLGLWAAGDQLDAAVALLVWGRQVAGILAVGSVGHLGWEWLSGPADERIRGGSRRELVALWLVSVLALVAVFSQPLPLVFLVVPVSVWCASRFPTLIAAVHATVLGSVALVLTISGLGPFAGLGNPYTAAMVTQVFLLTLLLTSLAVATLSDRIDDLVRQLARAQAQSAAQAELLSGMTESMGEGLIVLDSAGGVIQHNAASARLAQRFRPGGGDSALTALVTELAPPTWESGRRRPELGPGDVVVPLDDDSEMVLAMTSLPLTVEAPHGGGGTLLVLREVTEHRSGFRPLVEFAATTAHDLRGPLTAMRSWLSLIADEPTVLGDEGLRGPIERVDRAAVRMSDLIDDLLAHATAEGGRLAPENLVLTGDRGLPAQIAELAGVGDALSVSPDLPAVWADPHAVQQLFANVIGNALKYSQPGVLPRVEVSGHREAGRVVVDVRDHGVGVPEEDRSLIFERFHRSRSVTSSYAGTGLGLSLCRAIVERHGGTIECRVPTAGPGSVFRFDLPAADDDERVGAT